MRKFKKFAILTSAILTAATAMLSCLGSISVNGTESSSEDSLYEIIRNKDPDNNGYLSPSDSIPIQAYLLGLKTPYDDRLTHFDINNNGIISNFDSWLISAYFAGGFDGQNAAYSDYSNAADSYSANSSTAYWRHDCSSSNSRSYTSYSLSERNWNPYSCSTCDFSVNPSTEMQLDNGETAVVRLSCVDKPNSYCSGAIVGDHVIATAAHCVYDHNKGFKDIKIDIIENGITPIDTFQASYIHIPRDFGIAGSDVPLIDYALIYVEEDLSEYGKFEIGIAMDSYANASTGTEKVKISGFPGIKDAMPQGAVIGQRYVAEGDVVKKDNNNFIYYDNAHVINGHSGSPVYVEESFSRNGLNYGKKTMIAIHTNGTCDVSGGYINILHTFGTRITQKHALFYLSNPYISG